MVFTKSSILGLALAVGSTIAFVPLQAQAGTISGVIDFAGTVKLLNNSNKTVAIQNAQKLDFLSASVLATSGDFTAIADGTPATFTDFSFSPVLDPSPVDPLWSVGGFKFELKNISIDVQTNRVLALYGTGIVSGNGYDPTPGTWSFTTQTPSANGKLSFSASSAVPEPFTILGVGTALAFGAGFKRKLAKKQEK